MSPIGPYGDFNECVIKNSEMDNPEAYCAWLEHKITGKWPGNMEAKYPSPFMAAYDTAMVAGKTANEANKEAIAAAQGEGYQLTRFGWVKQFQAPTMKKITGVRIFGAGVWTDSAGVKREWTTEDLQKICDAFEAGVPAIVPIKCGHTSDEFNEQIAKALGVPVDVITGDEGQGQISLGNMTSLAIKGSWLIAGFDNVPEPIANLIEGGQYSTVSVEIEDTVGDFGPVITGVALLGAEEPAVKGASTERALVFGGSRQGARVYTFSVGDDIPMSTLRAEFDDIRGKVADLIKGKRGAPLFRAMFGNLYDLFERMTAGKHSDGGGGKYADAPDEVRAYADHAYQGNIGPLIAWAGTVGFDTCVAELTGKPGITDPVKVCGWLKGQAHSKVKGGNSTMKKLEGKKPDEIRKMTLADVVKLAEEGETPTVEDLKAAFQEGDLVAIAAALGLGEEATVEDIVAAIKALMDQVAAAGGEGGGEGGEEGGEMKAELKKANDKITALQTQVDGATSLAAWKEKAAELTSIPGTAQEHAEKLSTIEAKAGKEAAETQFAALKSANDLAAAATKIVGTNRQGEPTDFDKEVTKYQAEHTDKDKTPAENKAIAIKAVAAARPDLYHARPERQ